ncbi:hypothetical protein Pmar_PMAR014368, partial [Perkinsus marinus ATCC 50983]
GLVAMTYQLDTPPRRSPLSSASWPRPTLRWWGIYGWLLKTTWVRDGIKNKLSEFGVLKRT